MSRVEEEKRKRERIEEELDLERMKVTQMGGVMKEVLRGRSSVVY